MLVEFVFHYMLLAYSGIIDPNLNSYEYFSGLLIQAYYAKAVPRTTKGPNVFIRVYIRRKNNTNQMFVYTLDQESN